MLAGGESSFFSSLWMGSQSSESKVMTLDLSLFLGSAARSWDARCNVTKEPFVRDVKSPASRGTDIFTLSPMISGCSRI